MPDRNETSAASAAVGRLPSGLAIFTLNGTAGATGMLSSWIQQCSFEPLLITVALRQGRPWLDDLTPGKPFGLNIVPHGAKHLLSHFGKGFPPGEPAFDGMAVDLSLASPCLTDAVAWLDCRVVKRVDSGDHVLIISEVVDGRVMNDEKPWVHLRKDANRY